MKRRVLIADEQAPVRELLQLNFGYAGYAVELAEDGHAAQRIVDRAVPHLVVLDWSLPGHSGELLARRWRGAARTRDLSIIMLTARSAEADLVAALDAGVDDYVTKPFSTRALLARVRAVLRRRAPETLDGIVEIGGLRVDPASQSVTLRQDEGRSRVHLGSTEFRLLHLLATHPGRVFSRSQLLDRVWGADVFVEERTVDAHIKRLREALDFSRDLAMIETVRGAGYRLTMSVLLALFALSLDNLLPLDCLTT